MDNANNIFERKNLDGSTDYIVNIGTILYNNKIVSLSNLVIPLRQQTFFTLPAEKRYYAIINIYYVIEEGTFLFDTVKKSEKYISSYDSQALTNAIPIGQFVLQQSLSSFEVKNTNLYSNMSTFSITSDFIPGDRGAQGEIGATGAIGSTGSMGSTGLEGLWGLTGAQGDTGIGMQGLTGAQGDTGIYPDLSLLMYLKFKTNDDELTDYSVYERDLLWGATGAGITGMVYGSPGYTAISVEWIDQGQSSYTLEEGIVDNCHNVAYRGGRSGYTNDSYLGFTGTIHSWVNVDQAPIADFIYESGSTGIGFPVRFINASLYYPDSIIWDIEGDIYNIGTFVYSFGETGPHIVKMTASNLAGSNTKTELIMVE